MFERYKIDYAIFLILFSLLKCFAFSASSCTEDKSKAEKEKHEFKEREGVEILMSTVGPFNNPQETYDYFSLPFCKGSWQIWSYCTQICEECKCCKCDYKSEANAIDRLPTDFLFYGAKLMANPSGLKMLFKVDQPKREYCNRTLTAAESDSFAHAIQHNYWYQMRIDGMPTWAFVGQKDVAGTFFIFTHKKIEIGYNGQNIVSVNVIAEEKRPIEPNSTIAFTYEVSWKQSEVKFDHRFQSYLDRSFFLFKDHRIFKFCSILIIVFLIALTNNIVGKRSANWVANFKSRTKGKLQNKFHLDLDGPCNWNNIRDRIFCTPVCPLFFSSLLGIGISIIFFFSIFSIFSLFSDLESKRTPIGSAITFYIFLGGLFNSASGVFFYKLMGGKLWSLQAFVGTLLFPFIFLSVWLAVNLVAIESKVARAVTVEKLPPEIYFGTLYYLISFTVIALCINLDKKDMKRGFTFTVQQKKDEIQLSDALGPKSLCDGYPGPYFIALFGGFIIFASVFADLNFFFAGIWSQNVFYGFGPLLVLSIIILTIASVCVGITATYLMLSARDYSRWCWTSFCCGASVAIYILFYAFYFYSYKLKMSGLFQTFFYFGYNFLFAIVLCFYCGTIAFLASLCFTSKQSFKGKKVSFAENEEE